MELISLAEDKALLLDIAHQSIEHGLASGHALPIKLSDYPTRLHAWHASFVTLYKDEQLRGCIGHIHAFQSLLEDIADNAFAAAFKDHRFAPLSPDELPNLDISLSILSTPETINVKSEIDLLSSIKPGIDGLILEDKHHHGTFLPSVWETLPEPVEFLQQLRLKAGLPADYWSDCLQISRYTTQLIKANGA